MAVGVPIVDVPVVVKVVVVTSVVVVMIVEVVLNVLVVLASVGVAVDVKEILEGDLMARYVSAGSWDGAIDLR